MPKIKGSIENVKGRFRLRIQRDGRRITVGYYDTLEEAEEAREEAVILMFDEYYR